MRRRWVGLAVGLVAGAAWLVRSRERGAEPVGPRSEVAAAPETVPKGRKASVTAAPPRREAPDEVAPDRSEVAGPPEVARDSSDSAVEPGALEIEVVDPLGAAKPGVRVQLNEGREPNSHGLSASTDGNGRVVFAGWRAALAGASHAWWLRAELPFENAPGMRLDSAALAERPVRFELPPRGALELLVRELDGTPAPDSSRVRLRLLHFDERDELDAERAEWTLDVAAGRALFPYVELGRSWEVSAWRPNGAEPARAVAVGPRRLGETARVEIVLGNDTAVVTYRVLDPFGKPLARAGLGLKRGTLFGGVAESSVSTDDSGRFTLDAQRNFFYPGEFSVMFRTPSDVIWVGRSRLPDEPKVGSNEGGDIQLELEPLMCSGRVVDERGAPVAGAEVVVGDEQAWGFGNSPVQRTSTDNDGRFAFRGLWQSETFKVHAKSGPSRSVDAEVRQGAVDVVLVLVPRFTIWGVVAVDEGVDPGSISFALQTSSGERRSIDRKHSPFLYFAFRDSSAPAPPPGQFELEPIEGGTFDLLFLLDGVVLARRDGLVVHSDVDVGTIDLRGRLEACEIEFVGEGDLSGLAGDSTWRSRGSEQEHALGFSGPLLRILTASAPIDIELRPRGYRTAKLEGVRGRVQHVLEAPLRVRLVLVSDGEPPRTPYGFDCELYRGEYAMSQPVGPRWFTRERREIELRVSEPGRLKARWHLEKKIEGNGFGGAIGSHVLEEHWLDVEVRDEPGEQRFELRLDGAALNEVASTVGW